MSEIERLGKEKEKCESHNSEVIGKTQELRQQTQEINARIEASTRAFAEEASRAEKILSDLSANVNSYHRALFNYIPIKFENDDDDDNNDIDINNDDDDDDDDDDMGEYGNLNYRRGNEGNIGATSEDERDTNYI